MIKTCCQLCIICFTFSAFAQKKDAYYGTVLTQNSINDTAVDTCRLLYVRNITGNQLSVYKVIDGVVTEATAYWLTVAKNALFLFNKSLVGGQMNDSLCIAFQDKTYTVVINRDRYILFPTYYAKLKQEINIKHSIMALLNLLSDAIGDYPIADALPLLSYTPQLSQQIRRARVVTQRSQADMKDTWNCHYYYNRQHQLDSVSASSPEEIRFHKKIHYSGTGAHITTYLNIESRHTTDRYITYNKQNNSLVKFKERVYETGKDRETLSSVTLRWHNLGMLRKIEPSTAEVLKMLNP